MPVCPIHKAEMKQSKFSAESFYCASKMPDGSFCKEKYPPPQQPKATVAAVLQSQGVVPDDEHRRLAALAWSGHLCAGLADPDRALYAAETALAWLRRP